MAEDCTCDPRNHDGCWRLQNITEFKDLKGFEAD